MPWELPVGRRLDGIGDARRDPHMGADDGGVERLEPLFRLDPAPGDGHLVDRIGADQ